MTYVEGVTLDSPFAKFSHPVGDIPPWEALGYSTIAIPVVHPGLKSLCNSISEWMDEEVQSESSLGTLAGHGVNMDHPCVRVFTKEKVDANRKFLVASAKTMRAFVFFKVCFTSRHRRPSSDVLAQHNEGIAVDEKDPDTPRALMEFLKKRMPVERDELKPQWLRDFQDSQRRRRSMPL